MEREVTYAQLTRLHGALVELGKTNFPIRMSYRIASMVLQAEKALEVRDKLRRETVQQYGHQNEEGQLVLVSPDGNTGRGGRGWDEAQQRLREIEEITVPISGSISFAELEKEFAEDPPLNLGNVLAGLAPVLVDVDEAAKEETKVLPLAKRQQRRARARQT